MEYIDNYLKNHTIVQILLVGSNPGDGGHTSLRNILDKYNNCNITFYTASPDGPENINTHLYIDITETTSIDRLANYYNSFDIVIIDCAVFCHVLYYDGPNPQLLLYPLIKKNGIMITESYGYDCKVRKSSDRTIINLRDNYNKDEHNGSPFYLTDNLTTMIYEDKYLTDESYPEYGLITTFYSKKIQELIGMEYDNGNDLPTFEDIKGKLQTIYPLLLYKDAADKIVIDKLSETYNECHIITINKFIQRSSGGEYIVCIK